MFVTDYAVGHKPSDSHGACCEPTAGLAIVYDRLPPFPFAAAFGANREIPCAVRNLRAFRNSAAPTKRRCDPRKLSGFKSVVVVKVLRAPFHRLFRFFHSESLTSNPTCENENNSSARCLDAIFQVATNQGESAARVAVYALESSVSMRFPRFVTHNEILFGSASGLSLILALLELILYFSMSCVFELISSPEHPRSNASMEYQVRRALAQSPRVPLSASPDH